MGTLLLAVSGPAASGLSAAQVTKIDTYGAWDGTTVVYPFGCPNTSTYGETITIPAGMTSLDKFTVSWEDRTTGSFTVRGEVYAWDPSSFHATGSAIAETKPRTVHSGTSGFYKETFNFKDAVVSAGQQYVVFASVDKDFSACATRSFFVSWAAINNDAAYTGGTFVYQNDRGRFGKWTRHPWSSFGFDLAFVACFS